jgi:hypothetical protein
LDSLPANLETLFLNILKSVDFGRAAQLIKIVEKALELDEEGLICIQLSFADEDDPGLAKIPEASIPVSILLVLVRYRKESIRIDTRIDSYPKN